MGATAVLWHDLCGCRARHADYRCCRRLRPTSSPSRLVLVLGRSGRGNGVLGLLLSYLWRKKRSLRSTHDNSRMGRVGDKEIAHPVASWYGIGTFEVAVIKREFPDARCGGRADGRSARKPNSRRTAVTKVAAANSVAVNCKGDEPHLRLIAGEFAVQPHVGVNPTCNWGKDRIRPVERSDSSPTARLQWHRCPVKR